MNNCFITIEDIHRIILKSIIFLTATSYEMFYQGYFAKKDSSHFWFINLPKKNLKPIISFSFPSLSFKWLIHHFKFSSSKILIYTCRNLHPIFWKSFWKSYWKSFQYFKLSFRESFNKLFEKSSKESENHHSTSF